MVICAGIIVSAFTNFISQLSFAKLISSIVRANAIYLLLRSRDTTKIYFDSGIPKNLAVN